MTEDIDGVLNGTDRWALLRGEALSVLRGLPDSSVDAVVTDPPYSSGGAFRGDRMLATGKKYVNSTDTMNRPDFAGDNRDAHAYGYWSALWLHECLRVAKPGSVACMFTDWRQLAVTTDAIQAGGWVWRGVFVWDKTEGVRPRMGAFRSQCEYVVWGSAGPLPAKPEVGVLPGVVRAHRREEDRLHVTGKPIPVMRELVKICPPGGVVLDPFAGSGSTGVASLLEGRRFLGVELTPAYAEVAVERLTAEGKCSTVQAAQSGQGALFE